MQNSSQKSTGAGAAIGTGVGAYYGGPQGAAAGGQIGADVGSMFGGSPYKAWKRSLRKQYEYQARYAGSHFKNTIARAKEAGIHPLVAMGISPSGAGISTSLPGQHGGSAVRDAAKSINRTVQDYEVASQNRQLHKLAVERAKLDNDYVREQIRDSQFSRAAQFANSQQDGIARGEIDLSTLQSANQRHNQRIIVSKQKPYEHATKTTGYSPFGAFNLLQRPGKLSLAGAEEAVGDLGQLLYALPSILQDIGYTLDKRVLEPYQRRSNKKRSKDDRRFQLTGPQP